MQVKSNLKINHGFLAGIQNCLQMIFSGFIQRYQHVLSGQTATVQGQRKLPCMGQTKGRDIPAVGTFKLNAFSGL